MTNISTYFIYLHVLVQSKQIIAILFTFEGGVDSGQVEGSNVIVTLFLDQPKPAKTFLR